MAKDKVISGDYEGALCSSSFGGPVIIFDSTKGIHITTLNKGNVKNYEIIDAEQRKSGTSGVLRAGAGALLLGPIGLVAGLSAKRKGIYTIAIEFHDGKRSLIEVGEKNYKKFIQDMF